MSEAAGTLPILDRAELLEELTARAKAYVDERFAALCRVTEAGPAKEAAVPARPPGRGPIVPVDFGAKREEPQAEPDEPPRKVAFDIPASYIVDEPKPIDFRPRAGAAGTVNLRLTPSGNFALATFRSAKPGEGERIVPLRTLAEFRETVEEYGRRFWEFDLEGDLAVFAGWLRKRMTTPPPIEPPARESDSQEPAQQQPETFAETVEQAGDEDDGETEASEDEEPETLTPEFVDVREVEGEAEPRKRGKSKLTRDRVRSIFLDKRPAKVIAACEGITAQSVYNIKRRLVWADATADLVEKAGTTEGGDDA